MEDTAGIVRLGMPYDQRPESRDLYRFLTDYCKHWRGTGLQLGLKTSVLDQVEADHHTLSERFRVTLEKWLQLNVEVTWSNLELAITNANRETLGLPPLTTVPTSQSEVTVMQSHDNQPRQDNEKSQVDDNNEQPTSLVLKPKGPQSTLINVKALNNEFTALLLNVCQILSNCPNHCENLEICKKYCALLRVGDNSKEPLFSAQKITEIKECNSFEHLFQIINLHMSWDEHSILTQIVDQCDSVEGQREIEKFEEKLALCQGLEVISSESQENMSKEFVRFLSVIDKPYRRLTIEEYTKVKTFIFSKLKTHAYAAIGYFKILYRSLHIEWFVTDQAVPHMIKNAQQSKDVFIKEGFIFMQIGCEVLIDIKRSHEAVQLTNMISKQLDEIVTSLSSKDREATLLTLRRIFDNIIQHPNDDKYRQIKLTSKTFSSKVWQYPAGEELMKMSGWVVEDDHVRLKDDSCVEIVLQLLTSFLSSATGVVPFPDAEFQALIKAFYNGDTPCVQKLLKVSHISPNGGIYSESGSSLNLLEAATIAQQIDIVKLLLTNFSMDPYVMSVRENESWPYIQFIFYIAPQSFIIAILKYYGVKSDFKTTDGLSLLHCAVAYNCFNVICFLLEECSDIDVNVTDNDMCTPLHYAYLYGHTQIAQYLIQHGADVYAVDNYGHKPYGYIDGDPSLIKDSVLLQNRRKIHHIPYSIEHCYFMDLINIGIDEEKAVSLTMEQFPLLKEDAPTQPHYDIDHVSALKKFTQLITHSTQRSPDDSKKQTSSEVQEGNNLWTQEDLKKMVSKPTKEAIPLPKSIEVEILQIVLVCLVTVNTDEILATQGYLLELDGYSYVYKFSKNINQSEHQSKEIIYYIGKYGDCPAAICNVPYGSENNVFSVTHELFPNLGAVISVGVADGIAGKSKINDVLISSKVICCNKAMDELQTVTISQQLTDIFTRSIIWDSHIYRKLVCRPSVKFGLILSSPFDIPPNIANKIDSEAIGIENDKANLFANVQHSRVNIVIVKAISGFGEKSLYQPTAAVLAAYLVFKCLSSEQALKVLTAKMKSLEMIQQAKDENLTIKVRHAKILFCGAAHAGKTSFSRLLQGKPHIYDYESTQIGETRQVISDKVSLESSKWVVLDRELETENLMMYLYQLLQKSEIQKKEKTFNNYATTSTVKLASNKPPAKLVQSIKEAVTQVTETKSGNQQCFDDVPETQSSVSVLDSQPTELPEAKEESSIGNFQLSVEKEMADLSIPELRDKIPDAWDIFTLLDSGGQPEFIKMLPAINDFAAITFVVLNMCEGKKCINDNVNAQYNCKDHKYPEHELKYTYKELIECLLSSVKIATKVQERKFFDDRFIKEAVVKRDDLIEHPKPVVCFIGTHADELKNKIDAVVGQIDEEISRLDVMAKESQAFTTWNDFSTQRCLIPIDNTTTKENAKNSDIKRNTIKAVKEIHDKSNKLLKEKTQYEIPISWFILELEIRKHCKVNEVVCLFLHEIKEIYDKIMPNDSSMNIEMITEVMKFYHMFGTLLYFHEVKDINDIVITDPQWLFNNLTKIIMCKFDRSFLHCGTEIHDMKNKGICSENLLKKLTLDLRQGVNIKSFLELLVYLKVIARINDCQYFIPSVLPTQDDKSLSAVENDEPFGKAVAYTTNGKEIKIDPLFITSKFGTIPRGLFGFLVVQLLQEKQTLHSKSDCFADLITFQIKPWWYFTLTDKISYLMLQVRVEGKNRLSYHYHVQTMVTKALKIVCDQFDWQLSNCRYGFLCKKCTSKEHPSILPNELPITSGIEDYTECMHDEIMEFKEEQRIWFQKVDGYKQKVDVYLRDDETNMPPRKAQPVPELPVDASSEIMNKKPEMADLNKIVIPKVMNQWEELAEGFHYDDEVIANINTRSRGNPKKCCQEFFRDWRKTDNGIRAGPKTWSTLFYIIEKYMSIASDIREDMITKVKQLKSL